MFPSPSKPKADRSSRGASRNLRLALQRHWPVLVAATICLCYMIVLQMVWGVHIWSMNAISSTAAALTSLSGRHTLVLYVFANTDPEFLGNLQYFIREAVEHDTLCNFVIAVQKGNTLQDLELPVLPPHAKYVYHDQQCYDWGVFGWLLKSQHVRKAKYRHLIFINSSVRGPFMPAYARGKLHWTFPLLSRLSRHVKLVGPTISCEGSPLDGDQTGIWRRNPHVQSYAVATDQVGLQLLLADERVFRCYRDRWNTIYYSELGSSAAILDAGYNIDCLMARYQGVDWRNKSNWDCNARVAPVGEHYCDGTSLDPMEVMFVKLKRHTLAAEWSASKLAMRYTNWQQASDDRQLMSLDATELSAAAANTSIALLTANQYLSELPRFKTPKILEMRARGGRCFDFDYYRSANPDLAASLGASKVDAWRHFVYYGQFDARPFRFFCESLDYDRLVAWP